MNSELKPPLDSDVVLAYEVSAKDHSASALAVSLGIAAAIVLVGFLLYKVVRKTINRNRGKEK